MDFPVLTQPERLYWLFLIPLLWLLSRPLRPRHSELTAHLAQWMGAYARVHRALPKFRWPRFILLVTAFVGAVLAWSGPRYGVQQGPGSLVMLVDTSASMAARGCWEGARARVQSALDSVPDHVDVQLVLCGERPRIIEGDRDVLMAALPLEPAGIGRVDLGAMARDLSDAQTAVWTLTDGFDATVVPLEGALALVGDPASNVAITRLKIEDRWPLSEVVVELELHAFGPISGPLQLLVEGNEYPPTPIVFPGGKSSLPVRLMLRRGEGGGVRIYLQGVEDALQLDDFIELRLPPPPAPDIAVLADGEAGPWIELAARILARETGGRVLEGVATKQTGFLLVEGGVLDREPGSMRFVSFGTRRHAGSLSAGDFIERPAVLDWDRQDPITAGLDLSELEIDSALREGFIGRGKSLVWGESPQGQRLPLVVVEEGENHASIHTSFQLADSNFAKLPAFPQFLRRCFARSYLDRAQAEISPSNLLSAEESNLQIGAQRPTERPLRPFGSPGFAMAVPLLLLALGAIVLRVYV